MTLINDFNSLPDPLPAPLSEEIMIDWIDGIISDEEGKKLADQAGVPHAYQAVLEMRRAAACAIRTPEPIGETRFDSLTPDDLNVPALSEELSQRVRFAANQAWHEHSFSISHPSASAEHRLNVSGGVSANEQSDDVAGASTMKLLRTGSNRIQGEFWHSPSFQRFAAAASITLAMGCATWLAMSHGSAKLIPESSSPFASMAKSGLAPAALESTLATTSSDATSFAAPIAESGQRTTFATRSEQHEPTGDESEIRVAMTLADSASTSEVDVTRVIVDPQRAVELAREGRLLIRVGAVSGSAIPQLDSLESSASWHVREEISQSLIEAVRPFLTAPEKTLTARATEAQASGTGFGPPDPPEGSNVFAAMRHVMFGPDAPWNETSATYMIDVANSQDALETVRSVTQQRFAANVRFEELPKPVGQVDWNGRLSVPVIVESH